jgi:tRNA A-37 threonylcarbamoyl transferase component Bud32
MNENIREKTQILKSADIEAEIRYHGIEIIRLISDKGGMADVYEAWQPSVKRRIAAKRLKPHLVSDVEVRSRFEEEAMFLGQLNHPNIVQVIDYSSERLTLFMEFIDGKPLDELLAVRVRLSLEESLRIVSGVLDGLSYAHERNIIHRDVKPGNIFITSDNQVKLGDFGIASIIGAETIDSAAPADSWAGTPSYISPEQLTGAAVNGRADIYAVGVVLYLLLTGKLPFVGEDSIRTASMRLTHDPVPPSSLNPTIPPELEAVVLKAMSRHPEGRYQTAAEFRQALEALFTPGRGLSYLNEARAELEKAQQASTTEKRRLLTNCVKLSQMALTEQPDFEEAAQLLNAADAELSGMKRRVYLIGGAAAALVVLVIAVLVMQLSRGVGTLDLFTNDPANVYLDGKMIGTSPFMSTNIPTGSHRLYIEQPGYYTSHEREILVKKGAVVSISEPIPDGGTIVVSSPETGAPVFLDGREIGRTPLTQKVVVGKHTLKVSGKELEIVVLENDTSTISIGN